MKRATLARADSTDQGTPGVLTFGTEVCRTLELPWRDNKPQRSCIPTGTYSLLWLRSPKFGFCYHVLSVPGRANVLIHAANFAGDVELGWVSQLHGCIAPCLRLGMMRPAGHAMQMAGLVSRPALERFQDWGNKDDITLEIY